MKCFYHHANDAVAICKSFNKGLCFACAVEVENGVACKGKCEAEVGSINEQLQRGKKAGMVHLGGGVVLGALGLWYIIAGIRYWDNEGGKATIMWGVVLIAAAIPFISLLIRKKSAPKLTSRKSTHIESWIRRGLMVGRNTDNLKT